MDYSPSNKREEVHFNIPDIPFATDLGKLKKESFQNPANNEMLKLGLAEDYRFWLDRIEQARKIGDKERERQANVSLKNLIDRIMNLPEADIEFIQGQIGNRLIE